MIYGHDSKPWRVSSLRLFLGIYLSLYNWRPSREVDRAINDILDKKPTVKESTSLSIDLVYEEDGKEQRVDIWAGNAWYGFASSAGLMSKDGKYIRQTLWRGSRPRRRTLMRLALYIRDNEKR